MFFLDIAVCAKRSKIAQTCFGVSSTYILTAGAATFKGLCLNHADLYGKDSPLVEDKSSTGVAGGRPGPSSHCSLSNRLKKQTAKFNGYIDSNNDKNFE